MLKWMWSWASWNVHHFKRSKQILISGFWKTQINEAVSEADQLAQLCENPFAEIFMITNWKHFWLILSTVAILHYGQFHLSLCGRKIRAYSCSFYKSLLLISLYYAGERKN